VNREVDDELAPDRARVREDEHEEPQSTLAAWNGRLANVGPVDLRLLANKRLGAEIDLAARSRSHARNVLAKGAHGALEAPRTQHVVQSRSAQRGIAREDLVDEVAIWLDDARARQGTRRGLAADPEDAAHDVGV
jgi:hypothetical protein